MAAPRRLLLSRFWPLPHTPELPIVTHHFCVSHCEVCEDFIHFCVPQLCPPFQSYGTSNKLSAAPVLSPLSFHFLLPVFHFLFRSWALWLLARCLAFLYHAAVLSPSLWCHWPSASTPPTPVPFRSQRGEQQMTCTKNTVFKYLYTPLCFPAFN